MDIKFFFIFLTILLFSYLVVHFFKNNKILIDKPDFSFHKKLAYSKNNNNDLIPLCGGFILLISVLFFFENTIVSNIVKFFSILIYFLGFLSDVNKITKPVLRFIIQILIISLFVIITDIKILDLRSEFLNKILALDFVSYVFVIFCILIILNGSNFIDGININLLVYYLLILLILINLSFSHDFNLSADIYILFIILIVLTIYNFSGKLYMGDSGAYLLSFLICFFIIKFHNEYNFISPYFICLLLWYPAFETFFSISRRLKSNHAVSNPDIKHLHQLLYLYFQIKFNKNKINSSFISILINAYNLMVFFVCAHYFNCTKIQILFIFFNIAIYLTLYIKLLTIVKKLQIKKL